MSRIGIKQKLIFSFLGVSLIPLAGISIYSYYKSQSSLTDMAKSQVESVRSTTKQRLDQYFNSVSGQMITLSNSNGINQALKDFTDGFFSYQKEAGLSQVDILVAKKQLSNYYKNDFEAEFLKQNPGKSVDSQKILDSLSNDQILMQSTYIANNKYPLGNKHKLDSAADDTLYNKAHSIHHLNLREYLEKFGYYDIFLVDADTGTIVYSVFKELDFGTSLKNGPFTETSLGQAFRSALTQSDTNKVSMSDYSQYFPSYDSPAGFVSSGIFENGKVIGVLIFQLSFDEINKITLAETTTFKTLETFLVGNDYKMRSDSRIDSQNRSVRASFKDPTRGSIKNEHIDMALKGESLIGLGKDFLSRDVVFSVSPYEVFGNKWSLNTIVTQEEAFQSVAEMRWALFLGALLAAFGVGTVALLYARSLALKLTSLATGLKDGAETVFETSKSIGDISQRLSEASSEQAASLQETVASIDEISAMVQRNADSATSSSKASEVSTTAAHRGQEKVQEMMTSINSISKGNEDIMSSIQKSNQEISEIVHVIQSIADKTKVINDIVFQTKLLSFNASVEAARAGEHGKGFAVVAEEVGNLASMSGKAATEISNMLDQSVQRVTKIVEGTKGMMDSLIRTSKDKVDHGTRTAKECASALDEIMRNVSSVNEMVREISTASQEQSSGVREINKAMSELDQVTQQNSASSNDASTTARELNKQAQRLNNFVNDLAILVHGHSGEQQKEVVTKAEKSSPVVKLDSYRQTPKSGKPAVKKVVGLEFETPKGDDSRFEDV